MAPPEKGKGIPHHGANETEDGGDSDVPHPCDGSSANGMPAVDQEHKACDEHTQGEQLLRVSIALTSHRGNITDADARRSRRLLHVPTPCPAHGSETVLVIPIDRRERSWDTACCPAVQVCRLFSIFSDAFCCCRATRANTPSTHVSIL